MTREFDTARSLRLNRLTRAWIFVRKMFFILAMLLLFGTFSRAGTISVSFLQDEASLQDTVNILTNRGCSRSSIARYQQAVQRYFQEPFDFDFRTFPKPTNGFYAFSSTQALLAALPHHPGRTQHAFNFNCMDFVITMAGDQLQTALKPDEIFGPYLVSVYTTNGTRMGYFATARDAFTQGYVPQYREATEAFFPKPHQDSRICLTAGLYRIYVLPLAIPMEKLDTAVMEVLRATWRQEGIQFPQRCEVVLVHSADTNYSIISTDHAGLLFHSTAGYVYLEKAGGSGPFVRLDFKDKSDLVPWLAAAFLYPRQPHVQRFATFNADSIRDLDPK